MKHKILLTLVLCAPFFAGLLAQANFFDVNTIQEINIKVKPENWGYTLDSLRFNGDEMLEATVVINGKSLEKAGVRYRDSRAFTPGAKRNALYLDLAAYAGSRQTYAGHRIVQLSSALRDPSMVREVLAHNLAATYFHAPRANYAKVYVNDKYYGLFVNVEAVEGDYLTNAYGSSGGNLYLAHPNLDQKPGQGCGQEVYGSLQQEKEDCLDYNFDAVQGDLSNLQLFINKLNAPDAQLEQLLDIDETLWMLALNNLLVNLNSYTGKFANNYYLYQDAAGKMHPAITEMNLAFGSFKNIGGNASDLKTPELLTLSPLLHADEATRPLIAKLLANETWRKQYMAHYRTLLIEQVLNGKLAAQARNLQALIQTPLTMDTGKYYDAADFGRSLTETIGELSKIPGLVDFITKRGDWLEKQEVYTLLPSEITAIGVEKRQRFSSTLLDEFRIHANVSSFPKHVVLHYRFTESGPYQTLEMADDGEHYDGKAADSVFGAVVKPASGQTMIYYYISAENARTLNYAPSRYNFEQFKASLTEINQ